MKTYTGYMSVKFTKYLYLVNVGNSPEVRLWESACNLLLQRPPAPWLASCQTVAREQTWRRKGISAAIVEEEEKKKANHKLLRDCPGAAKSGSVNW